jgi:hypothetical protein
VYLRAPDPLAERSLAQAERKANRSNGRTETPNPVLHRSLCIARRLSRDCLGVLDSAPNSR